MSENLQNLLRESLLNNSYDYDAMHNSLKKTWMNSFSYLYKLQNAYIEYEELFYFSNDTESRNSDKIGHLYLDELLYACFNVDYDLIHVTTREEYRTSEFYLKEITPKDISYNPDIFLKIPIVIIDDQVIWDYTLKISKDCTHFKLPFKRSFVLEDNRNPDNDEIIYKDHKIQVLVVENSFYQRFRFNKNHITINEEDKFMLIDKSLIENSITNIIMEDTNSDILKKYHVNNVSDLSEYQNNDRIKTYQNRIKYCSFPKQSGTMLCSFHFLNSAGNGYELGTELIPVIDKGAMLYADLTNNLIEKINNCTTDFYLSVCHCERLYGHTFFNNLDKKSTIATSEGADLFILQESEFVPYQMPVPVENLMIFKKSSDKFILEKNTDMVELFYPNIYHIKDETMKENDEYKIYYFYHKADDLKYTVLFDFYYTFLHELVSDKPLEELINDIYYDKQELNDYTDEQKIKFKEVFNKIISYKYFNHQYGESDFLHRYLPIPENNDKEPVEYKDETLKEWIRVEPWVLRDYVLDQNKLGSSYHLFTNTLDLSSRIRNNPDLEMGTPSIDFDEPRYVFAFNNEKEYPILLNAVVFVDGIMVGDIYQDRKLFMDYFYIPCDMVTEDSYIELEIFPEYDFRQELTFTSLDDEKEITLVEPSDVIFPTMEDVYFETPDLSDRYSRRLFDYTIHYSRADIKFEAETVRKPVKFTRLSTFKVKPNDEIVLNKPLNFTITKHPRNVRFMVEREGYCSIEIIEKGFSFSTEYLRVYRNGRLLPRSKYVLMVIYKRPILRFVDWFEVGDLIYVDITPYKYKEIYYKEELTPNDTIIDLRSIVNKPFDIRYYDVYMNGRKLSLNNVFSITPWQITLVNLKSNYNLFIYERERDWEYFGLDYKENIYYYTFDDLLKDGLLNEDLKNKMIKDIIDSKKDKRLNIYPNTNDEEKMDVDGDDLMYNTFHIFYFDDLIPLTYMDPDVLQQEEEIIVEMFREIYDNYVRVPYDESYTDTQRERRLEYTKAILLDPDIHLDADDEPGPYLVFEVGHTGDISQEFLDQKVVIPDKPNISKS